MAYRTQEKLQQAKRRLSAVAFLTNISLDGSYKDSGWPLEYAKQQEAIKACESSTISGEQILRPLAAIGGGDMTMTESLEAVLVAKIHEATLRPGLRHQRRTSDGNKCEYGDDDHESEYLNDLIRARANTVHIEPKYIPHILSRQDSSGRRGHGYFSSSESVDHPGPKGKLDLSNTNVSESSSTEGKAELKFVPMCNVNSSSLVINRERLIVLVNKRTVIIVFSVIPYTKNTRPLRVLGADRPSEGGLRRRNTSGSRPIPILVSDSPIDPLEQLVHRTNEEVSYGYLIRSYTGKCRQQSLEANALLDDNDLLRRLHVARYPSQESGVKFPDGSYHSGTGNSSPSGSESHDLRRFLTQYSTTSASTSRVVPCLSTYSPHLLDDPEFRAGKHRTLLTFPSYITSVIDYCKPSDMKKELNDKFRDRFPQIELTLSKLKSLKRDMRKVVKTECNIDLLTVAQAFVYFEKLILGSFVTKYNRKFCAGACILLSAKLNDVKGSHLHSLLDIIERTFRVSRKDLITFEFAVLVALEFTLHLPTWEVFPHYQRLLYES